MGEMLDTELQQALLALLKCVAAGERITIPSEGRPVAELDRLQSLSQRRKNVMPHAKR